MVGVLVTLRYQRDFDPSAVREIATSARGMFEGMPGLRSKAFTLNEEGREATNFYVWESEEEARAFFTDELEERITGLYGVRPTIQFVEIAALVDNAH
jgi:heme-degrading monooxygenase HmoA